MGMGDAALVLEEKANSYLVFMRLDIDETGELVQGQVMAL